MEPSSKYQQDTPVSHVFFLLLPISQLFYIFMSEEVKTLRFFLLHIGDNRVLAWIPRMNSYGSTVKVSLTARILHILPRILRHYLRSPSSPTAISSHSMCAHRHLIPQFWPEQKPARPPLHVIYENVTNQRRLLWKTAKHIALGRANN